MILLSMTETQVKDRMRRGMKPAMITKISIRNLRLVKKSLLRLKIVSNSPFCIHVFRIFRIVFDFFPEPPHMHIHRADITGIFIAPDKTQELFPAVDFVRVEGKHFDQILLP